MTDNFKSGQADPAKSNGPLLAGAIELTPEARAILTKQVNRKIVWGYKVTKAVFRGLSLIPLLASVFLLVVCYDLALKSATGFFVVTAIVVLPALFSAFLFRLASKI